MTQVVADLSAANLLHAQIASTGLVLRDGSNVYQPAWAAAGTRLLADYSGDYDWLELQGGP